MTVYGYKCKIIYILRICQNDMLYVFSTGFYSINAFLLTAFLSTSVGYVYQYPKKATFKNSIEDRLLTQDTFAPMLNFLKTSRKMLGTDCTVQSNKPLYNREQMANCVTEMSSVPLKAFLINIAMQIYYLLLKKIYYI